MQRKRKWKDLGLEPLYPRTCLCVREKEHSVIECRAIIKCQRFRHVPNIIFFPFSAHAQPSLSPFSRLLD